MAISKGFVPGVGGELIDVRPMAMPVESWPELDLWDKANTVIYSVDFAREPDSTGTSFWIDGELVGYVRHLEVTDRQIVGGFRDLIAGLEPIRTGDVAQMIADIDRVELTPRTLRDRMVERFENTMDALALDTLFHVGLRP